ncbi:MAG: BrnT family toxin [Pseudomonadota bacterium]
MQKIEVGFDAEKRRLTLERRGLDMTRAGEIFAGPHQSVQDSRQDYGEDRWITMGYLDDRMVVLVWTERGDTIRVISLRKANGREQRRHGRGMGGPG